MCKRFSTVPLLLVLSLAGGAWADLVGWWKLDDGAGTVVKDSSGNGIDGNFVGNPKWVEGMNGTGGLELDGTCWVDFGNPPKALFTGTMPMSAALWIYPTNLGATLAGAGADRAFLSRNQDWAFKASGPYARFTTPGVLDYNAQKTVLKVGEWQHVTVTFQPGVGVAGVAVFYLDGVETDRISSAATNGGYNAAAATSGASVNGGPLLLGNNQWTSTQFYFGRYDDVRLYNHILTPKEVVDAMHGAGPELASGPNPNEKATDVPADIAVAWTPGAFAATHDVYLGTSFADVNSGSRTSPAGVLASQGQTDARYDPDGLLGYGQTYDRRIDEVDVLPRQYRFQRGYLVLHR